MKIIYREILNLHQKNENCQIEIFGDGREFVVHVKKSEYDEKIISFKSRFRKKAIRLALRKYFDQ